MRSKPVPLLLMMPPLGGCPQHRIPGHRTDTASHRVPIIALCLALAILTVPDDLGLYGKEKQPLLEAMKTFDFTGSFLMATSVTSLILGLGLGGNVLPCTLPLLPPPQTPPSH